jgi:very-short-patch-repair endonuclease
VPAVAWQQGGVFTRRQAVTAGATVEQVRWRLRKGVWVPVLGSVVRSAAREPDEWTEAFAAHLTWSDSIVVLGTAARAHRLPVPHDGLVHVVVPSGRAARGRLTPHQFGLDDGDVTEAMGIPVTTRRRTILDCLGRLAPGAALDLLAWVSSRRLLEGEDVARWLAEHPGRWGNPARARAGERLARGAVNPAEDRLHAILRRARITGWLAGESLVGHLGIWVQADVYFPDVRLVIEVDGRRAHGDDRFQSDRTRQNLLVAAGCTVLRYTWADLVERPAEVAAQVRRTLALLRAAVS